jgi:glycosyltransferase involved in cell wall biosynthesis
MPELSFVIPTHDRPDLLRIAVESVLAQTVTDLELIVVDDGSTPPVDLDVDDARVRLLRTEGLGPSAARNVGLREAAGRFVVFVDDDDEITADMAEVSLEAIDSSSLPPPVAALSAVRMVSDEGTELGVRLPLTTRRGESYPLVHIPGRSQLTHATVVVPTETIRHIGGFDELFRGSEHDDFFMRLSEVCSLQGIDHVTYVAHLHNGPRNSTRYATMAQAHCRFVDKHRDKLSPVEQERYLSIATWDFLSAGETWEARRTAWRASRLHRSRRSIRALVASAGGAGLYRRLRHTKDR